MGRRPCCSEEGLNRGAWTAMEDKILRDYIKTHGEGKWRNLPKIAGLKRCGKSCRLRWLNYLRPDIKRGNITHDEEDLIIRLHKLLGNRWSLIAGRLPGRTDNEIKNYWNTNISKKFRSQQNSKTTPPKSSGQSKEKSGPTTQQSIGRPPSPTLGSNSSRAVRTKASRCTKVSITTDPLKIQQLEPKPEVGLGSSTTVVPEPVGRILPLISGEENNPNDDFMIDFEIEEKFLTHFLDTEFGSVLCDLEGGGDGYTNTRINDTRYLSPNSNETVSLSQEMVHVSDLGSMISVLDPEINWLLE